MSDTEHDNAGVIAPPPLIFAAGIGLGLLAQQLVPLRWLPESAAKPLGWALTAASLALGGSAARTFFQAQTTLDPHGSTTAIVRSGPFRYTRNPIYLSFAILTIAVAAWRNALWPVVLLPAVIQVVRRGVIEREERYLERKFGPQYTEYKAQVRRWL